MAKLHWHEKAKCRVCKRLVAVGYSIDMDPEVAYYFVGTTYSGHRVFAPGHWGYNFYFVHEDKDGQILRASIVPSRLHPLIKEGAGELRGKFLPARKPKEVPQ
jgi:hypothetical protein